MRSALRVPSAAAVVVGAYLPTPPSHARTLSPVSSTVHSTARLVSRGTLGSRGFARERSLTQWSLWCFSSAGVGAGTEEDEGIVAAVVA